ncbi:MAG: alpha/beta hydrolase [Candidatus Protistobacter heckmanni]|nr:alpha/beta hydrolase [Candidatus Protistobacter heckmanni]
MRMKSNYVLCEEREIHYTEWGAGNSDVIIAWHGLARTCRDMDDIAAHLASRGYRVICPDTIGRGLSQWSPHPGKEYCLAFYGKIAVALADNLKLARFGWLGTSMGGALGAVLAAGAFKERIRALLLNDIGPSLAPAAVERIRGYAGKPPAFNNVTELEAYLRQVYKPYGPITDEGWRRMTETSVRRLPDGRVTTHYDPDMVLQFVMHPLDYERWYEYDQITAPVLCLRGENSDLLLPEVTEEMKVRGPRAEVVTLPGVGHAPALNTPEQFELVERFFARGRNH